MVETLKAACCALNYALAHTRTLDPDRFDTTGMLALLEQSKQALLSAKTNDPCDIAPGSHAANAMVHLRVLLRLTQDPDERDDATLSKVTRSAARALSLLYPLAQAEDPIFLVNRRDNPASRRRTPTHPRRDDRRSPHFDVELGQDTETNFFTGFGGDIFSGGLFIATYDIHPVGTTVGVKAKLPNGRVLAKKATVGWIREFQDDIAEVVPGMGVVFDEICTEDTAEIERFLAQRDALFYEAV